MGYEHQRCLSCAAADTNYWKWKQALTMYESKAPDTSKHIWGLRKIRCACIHVNAAYAYSNSYINKCSWQFKVLLILKQEPCLCITYLCFSRKQNKKDGNARSCPGQNPSYNRSWEIAVIQATPRSERRGQGFCFVLNALSYWIKKTVGCFPLLVSFSEWNRLNVFLLCQSGGNILRWGRQKRGKGICRGLGVFIQKCI